ncbi:MAG: multicopper oxidase family protein, partial [Actinomycetales bacterium]
MTISRRRFIGASAALAAGVGIVATTGVRIAGSAQAASAATPGAVLRSRDGLLRATLTAALGPAMLAGQQIPGLLTYNGRYPGPQLRVQPGDRLQLRLRNRTGLATNLHFHGMHVSPKGFQDNVFLTIDDGSDLEYDVQIPKDHPGGLNWYHPHLHGLVGPQVYAGLAGLLLVEGGIASRPEVASLRRRTLALNSVALAGTDEPSLVPYPPLASPNIHLVNGMHLPQIGMQPGETQFWQIANIGYAAYYTLQVPGGRIQVIEEDGTPAWRATLPQTMLLPPGKRFGVLVTAPDRPGQSALRTNGFISGERGIWPAMDLARIVVAGTSQESVLLDSELGPPAPYLNEPVAQRRMLVMGADFTPSPPVWNFNGVAYQAITMKDVFTVRRGTVEEWVIANSTGPGTSTSPESHPFHIHVNDFTIVERGTWDPVQGRSTSSIKVTAPAAGDTVNIDPGHYLTIRTKFADFTGRSVYHCHILFHEDHGMMGIFDIVDEDGTGPGPDQLLPT